MLKRAEEAPDYLVNDENGALLNTNITALEGYRMQRDAIRRAEQDHQRLDALEDSMTRIEQLLLRILNK